MRMTNPAACWLPPAACFLLPAAVLVTEATVDAAAPPDQLANVVWAVARRHLSLGIDQVVVYARPNFTEQVARFPQPPPAGVYIVPFTGGGFNTCCCHDHIAIVNHGILSLWRVAAKVAVLDVDEWLEGWNSDLHRLSGCAGLMRHAVYTPTSTSVPDIGVFQQQRGGWAGGPLQRFTQRAVMYAHRKTIVDPEATRAHGIHESFRCTGAGAAASGGTITPDGRCDTVDHCLVDSTDLASDHYIAHAANMCHIRARALPPELTSV